MEIKEGGTEAPTRHVIDWQNPDYTNASAIETELRRVFDICHGCRRCFNLCDSFPRLFDLIDNSESGEVESVSSADLGTVVDACTLCDMCFMTKCPYVPPHEFNLDFPHLMLRFRVAKADFHKNPFFDRQFAKTDRNGRLFGKVSGLANWGSKALAADCFQPSPAFIGTSSCRSIMQRRSPIGPRKTRPLWPAMPRRHRARRFFMRPVL